MLYDFEPAFSEERKKSKAVRKDSVMDAVQRKLKSMVMGEEAAEIFTLQNAKQYFLEMRKKYPLACQCAIHMERAGQKYEILQLLLDSDKEPIRVTTKTVVGRRVMAEALDKDMLDCFDNKSTFCMEYILDEEQS